jgi:FtsP/CotA-like multicopper oxidase with cupredoxin domain
LAGALIVLPKGSPAEPPTRVILIKNAPKATAAPAVQFAPRRLGLRGAPPRAVPSLGPNQFISGMRPVQGGVPCPSASPGQSIAVNGYTIGGNQLSSPPRDALANGQQQKLRIIDATANTYIDVSLINSTGHLQPLTVVGRDGVPINPTSDVENVALPGNPTDVQLPPGGRVDIIVTGESADQMLISAPVCTGFAGPNSVSYKLVEIGLGGSRLRAPAPHAPVAVTTARPHATRAEVARAHHRPVVAERWLSFTQYDDGGFYVTAGNPRSPGIVENPFWLARSSTPSNPGYYLQPNIETRQGNVELWHLVNAAPEIHAFHIHQLTFLGVSSSVPDQRARIANVRLDTLLLPPATQTGRVTSDGYPILQATQTDILIDFGQVDPGTFVYHCHMLFHEDHGMMGIIRVDPAPPSANR